jgi:ligand-binding SRPBCC domain-containing protein
MSKVYSLKTIQNIPSGIETVWEFFSNPANLKDITPAKLGFQIIGQFQGGKMYAGQIIEYYVKPVLNIPLYWMTEITHVHHHQYFIDEQRFGPYSLWHHQHHFKAISGGIEMTDIVHYKIPFSIFGTLAHKLFVKKQLSDIFNFRYAIVEQKFGVWKS